MPKFLLILSLLKDCKIACCWSKHGLPCIEESVHRRIGRSEPQMSDNSCIYTKVSLILKAKIIRYYDTCFNSVKISDTQCSWILNIYRIFNDRAIRQRGFCQGFQHLLLGGNYACAQESLAGREIISDNFRKTQKCNIYMTTKKHLMSPNHALAFPVSKYCWLA